MRVRADECGRLGDGGRTIRPIHLSRSSADATGIRQEGARP